jgi:hypothetical protein
LAADGDAEHVGFVAVFLGDGEVVGGSVEQAVVDAVAFECVGRHGGSFLA